MKDVECKALNEKWMRKLTNVQNSMCNGKVLEKPQRTGSWKIYGEKWFECKA